MENKVYIYGLRCPEKEILRYVGKSKQPKIRYYNHLSHAKYDKYDNVHLYRWIAKLLRHDLKPELIILEECNASNWKEREKEWISEIGIDNLLNRHEGGIEPPDNTGFKWSEEQLANHPSLKRKNKPQWTDKPHPMSGKFGKDNPNYGKKRSKEFCEMQSKLKLENNGMRGKKLSKERIEQIKESKRKPVALIDEEGNILKKYKSQKEATLELGLSAGAVTRVCKGEYKHTKGYRFKYL